MNKKIGKVVYRYEIPGHVATDKEPMVEELEALFKSEMLRLLKIELKQQDFRENSFIDGYNRAKQEIREKLNE